MRRLRFLLAAPDDGYQGARAWLWGAAALWFFLPRIDRQLPIEPADEGART